MANIKSDMLLKFYHYYIISKNISILLAFSCYNNSTQTIKLLYYFLTNNVVKKQF